MKQNNKYILSEKEKSFITYMKNNHLGIENAILGKHLKNTYGYGRKIRMMIHTLRANGYPIVSGNEGYWYAANKEEIDKAISYYDSYIEDLVIMRSGLKKAKAMV